MFSKNSDGNKLIDSQATTLPAKSGLTISFGNYIVNIGRGTPITDQTLAFDTSSDLTWAQCEPCAGHCYKQVDPIFDPSKSTSYIDISCLTPLCSQVTSVIGVNGKELQRSAPCKFPAIYNFGDSNSDTGGISAAFDPIRAPYGDSFFHKPAGRDSDGRVLIDFIAEHLRLPYLSAYLNSLGTNYRHGANFATGGSTIRRQNETIFDNGISPFSLDIQIVQFLQFKARTADLYNQAKTRNNLPRPQDFSKALYTFDIGQNDLSAGFRKMSFDQLRAALPDIVNQLATAVQRIYQQGGRTFWIHNTGPIGCLPLNFFYNHNPPPGYLDQQGCVKVQNDMAVEFNKQLKDRVIKLRAELPEAAITYVDLYAAKYGLISNAKNEGFVDPLKVCCGYHVNYDHVWCGSKAIVNGSEVYGASCANPSQYVSWDGVHYSQAANQWFANHILNGSLSDPPIPIIQACQRH